MAKVICTLNNASDLINGVKFTLDRGQRISEEISDDVAAHFASIPGYLLVGAKKPDEQGSGGGEGKANGKSAK